MSLTSYQVGIAVLVMVDPAHPIALGRAIDRPILKTEGKHLHNKHGIAGENLDLQSKIAEDHIV